MAEQTDQRIDQIGEHGVNLGQGPANGYAQFASKNLDEVKGYLTDSWGRHAFETRNRAVPLDTWMKFRRLSKLDIGTVHYGADVEIDKFELDDVTALTRVQSGAVVTGLAGGAIDNDAATGSIVSAEELRSLHISGDCVQTVLRIDNAMLNHHATLMMGRPVRQKIRFDPVMKTGGHGADWWQYVSLLNMELSAAATPSGSAVLNHLETLLVLKLLESQPSNYSEYLRPQQSKIAPHHVRKVEQYIIAYADQPITIEDLVGVANVSARALFDGFKRFRGTSPMALLKSIRLERARDDLLRGDPDDTVTTVACRWGFYQLGRFASQYKAVFGELPSDTLKKQD